MKNKAFFKKIFPHIVAVLIFFIISAIYFQPVFQGKTLRQGDVITSAGMIQEQKIFQEETGIYTSWCSAMFSGMPSFSSFGPPAPNVFEYIGEWSHLGWNWGFNLGAFFLYLIGFYVCLLAFRVNPWLSIVGALTFGLGTYNIIIIEAGHMLKCYAISMMPPIIAGIVMVFKRKYIFGSLLFLIALGLQLVFNHMQITYYTVIIAVVVGIAYFIYNYKAKQLKSFFCACGLLVLMSAIAIFPNSVGFFQNQSYVKHTMRGGSEITVTPEDLQKKDTKIVSVDEKKSVEGLDIGYAFAWSYGIGETFTILVPGLYGGGSGEKVSKDSEFYKIFRSEYAPLYWGDQPFTSGPVYFGAIICFLFVLGLFVVKGPEKWWIVAATIISILLSWGKNCMWLNEFLFNNLPLYNKFRVPSMSLVIANFTMVLMAMLTLKTMLTEKIDRKKLTKNLYISTAITGGLCLFFILISGAFSYIGVNDSNYQPQVLDIIIGARKSLLIGDSFRSLIFILLSAGLLWAYIQGKIKSQYWIITLLGVLIIIDLWGVDKRYLNEDKFVKKSKQTELIQPTQNDLQIKQYAAQFGDKNYRVFNLAGNPFNESNTSYFHHSIGGYSAVKLRRYQDIIDFYLSTNLNTNILNMLNSRYFIVPANENQAIVERNQEALGYAWFVNEFKFVKNPNEEILALNDFNPAQTAIIDERFANLVSGYKNTLDSIATIEMVAKDELYNPDYLTYKTKTTQEQMLVFSEVFYDDDGWNAYLDGKLVPYFRANYILRAMIVPAGEHTIEFKFEPKIVKITRTMTLIGSILIGLTSCCLLAIFYYCKKRKEQKRNK